MLTRPDQREYTLRFRLWRAPTGVIVDLVEVKRGEDEGYEFSMLGAHDADITALIEHVTAEARAEIATRRRLAITAAPSSATTTRCAGESATTPTVP